MLGWFMMSRSTLGVFSLWIKSANGLSLEGLLKAPAFQVRRFSATVFSAKGFLYKHHGSQRALGITESSKNSSSAFLGRSPPLRVQTVRIISPLFSNPAVLKAELTMSDKSGVEARKMCPPGTRTFLARFAQRSKKLYTFLRSFGSSFITLNLGTGCLTHPSNF